ncbi:UDP-glucose 4-epimerase [hydrothermal vent metagenome]|uniref:UDP-glucose 4-epimerase n=1 Tax=hydrothermal vent metagenome TaxID=652676 RepID=A0A3B0SR20_9ZZZZ
MNVLVTGGAGYIGSHIVIELMQAGHSVVIVDNLVNADRKVIDRLETITGQPVEFAEVDVTDEVSLGEVFDAHEFDAVIHMAGLKAVGESVSHPVDYYLNNVGSGATLARVMAKRGVRDLVFSSSATVYGIPDELPLTEESKLSAINPYGRTKLMLEEIFEDVAASEPGWNIILLRYFNPIGAHSSGLIGEDPAGIPNNLLPFVAQVAVGRLDKLEVFGNDWPTRDGTPIRDYIHVADLATGHVAALAKLAENPGVVVYNLGTGDGVTVLEVVAAFEEATGVEIPYEFVGRRDGDAAEAWADASKAERELGWKATRTLVQGCADSWNWQSNNPHGFRDPE